MERKSRPLIVAMKGHPGTGKSTLARAVSTALRCPLLDKDDVRDCTKSIQHTLDLSSNGCGGSSLLNDLSYSVLWRIAETQLGLGLTVVVDSPLSRPAHLDRLVRIACRTGARVVVVECRPRDEAMWRERLELRGQVEADGDGGASWHKPATWRDLERLVESYRGCTEYEVGDVARIVVDTTAAVEVGEMAAMVVEFIKTKVDCDL